MLDFNKIGSISVDNGEVPYLWRNRKLNRLSGYDYSQNGYYFITVCVKDNLRYLGYIKNGEMQLNKYGLIIKECWDGLPNHYRNCRLDEFVIMPNHIHGIIEIDNTFVEDENLKKHGLSEIVRWLKTFSARVINEKRPLNKFQWKKWFYDVIIREERALVNIREYIKRNPSRR